MGFMMSACGKLVHISTSKTSAIFIYRSLTFFFEFFVGQFGSVNTWKWCTEIFDYISLAALVDEKTFGVHGGLSPSINTLDQIRGIDRKQVELFDCLLKKKTTFD